MKSERERERERRVRRSEAKEEKDVSAVGGGRTPSQSGEARSSQLEAYLGTLPIGSRLQLEASS